MTFLWMFVGSVLGGWLSWVVFDGEVGLTGTLFGALFGLLFARTLRLGRRLDELESRVRHLTADATMAPVVESPRTQTPATPSKAPPAQPVAIPIPPRAHLDTVIDLRVAATRRNADADTSAVLHPYPLPSKPVPRTAPPALLWIKRWLSEGNPLVKAGIVVVFFGVAYLFKYAAEAGWLTVPVEFRFLGVSLVALAALAFAWHKRESHRAFALSLQGGAIGVLILTIFAAYRLYALLPPALTFVLLVVVVAGAGVLAVLQDALALAVLAIVGGFLAPILASNGSGDHVALFSYYAVLNAAIFLIAWVKSWRALNLVGFVFTFGIGTAWGALKYRPELFASTEPFLLLFFALYLLLPVLQARRSSTDKPDLLSGSLVFGTPLVVFALQAALLDGARMPLAYSAIGAAVIYLALAALELRRWGFAVLGQAHALLALGFGTLAMPLALTAQATTCTFALEGAALVWLGLRQSRRLPRWIGYALQGVAGAISIDRIDAFDALPLSRAATIDGGVLDAAFLAGAGLVTAHLLRRRDARAPLAMIFLVWGGLWWYAAGNAGVERFVAHVRHADAWLGFIAMTALIAVEAARRLNWRELLVPAALPMVLGLPFIALTTLDGHGPLEGWHLAAWPLWLIASWRALPAIAAQQVRIARVLHFVQLWTCALLASAELGHLGHTHWHLGDIWLALTILAPLAALYLFVLRDALPARWPLGADARAPRVPMLASLAVAMGIAWLVSLAQEGRPTPLPYLPVLNPLELAQIGYLVLLALWYRDAQAQGTVLVNAEVRARALALAGFVLLTTITLRCVHFFGGVAWNESMASSSLAQSALSIVWTLAGIAAMLAGKRRGSRAVWFGGAALMALVLVKLMLIDRNYLADLSAIVGVLVVGVLLVAVGYFAPVPPKTDAAGEKA